MKKKLLTLALTAAFILGFAFPSTGEPSDSVTVCSIGGCVLDEF